ncbi:hypothetical protein GCM10022251_06320 [Phytohabitans flavus]|uniref:DUF397 domain-containing protein n=1 Tax=Phytohabitans flavus TaxID=1076124 RepID=A0A6F8Y2E4_9ACTN|nr:DUF397 domain-containing protein [Phytohabitans flavus]BCB80199.1 hypothetical protein Pflav_066090 [Phytohabitans flavus]
MRLEDAGIIWRKSTKSGDSECLEFAAVGDLVLIRDSKDAGGPRLQFLNDAWRSFVSALRAPDAIHRGEDGGRGFAGR